MVNVEKGRGRSRKAAVRGNPINVKFIATIHHLKSVSGEKGGGVCVQWMDGSSTLLLVDLLLWAILCKLQHFINLAGCDGNLFVESSVFAGGFVQVGRTRYCPDLILN